MAMYLITYDLRKARNYAPLYEAFENWTAIRLLESVWLAELVGPASTVKNLLKPLIDADDGVAVIELRQDFDWATFGVLPAGAAWLQAHSP